MEALVLDLLGLVSGAASYTISNAFDIALGALLGPALIKPACGVVSDLLGRAGEVVNSVGKTLTKS